ncbi:acyl-CoA dehydrogenase [Rhodopirellula baltica]|nr:acyl-CoA dehydrogenase [Rhodopirellula baltica]
MLGMIADMNQNTAPKLDVLAKQLAELAPRWHSVKNWPGLSLSACGEFGILRGLAGLSSWPARQQLETLITLAKADLVTTFIITQHLGALKRLLASPIASDHEAIIEQLSSGKRIASVGISHLTTSRRHLATPAVTAEPIEGGYRLNGSIPWVTGAKHVDWIVVGASLSDGAQILALVDAIAPNLHSGPGAAMIAMEASCTDAVRLDSVEIKSAFVIAGPTDEVLSAKSDATKKTGGAGGLQTSALALGLSLAALEYMTAESTKRPSLTTITDSLNAEHEILLEQLLDACESPADVNLTELRHQANRLVQRTTAAAMTTAKGAGLMKEHPVARFCQQAFFFLVWSCPQPVADAHLCEMAGLEAP